MNKMIEFNGEVNGAGKKFLIKDQILSQLLANSIVSAILLTPTLIFGGFNSKISYVVMIFCGIFILFSALPTKSVVSVILPQRIVVDLEERTIINQLKNREVFGMIDSVKLVEDYGEFYNIKFFFGDRVPYCICQKSLLTSGTLEDFEALFDGKMIKKQMRRRKK